MYHELRYLFSYKYHDIHHILIVLNNFINLKSLKKFFMVLSLIAKGTIQCKWRNKAVKQSEKDQRKFIYCILSYSSPSNFVNEQV